MAVVGISLGSNMGDRVALLQEARKKLQEIAIREIDRVSGIYETEPVDCEPDAPSFLNAVIEIITDLDPMELLRYCQEIESGMGRPEIRDRNSPRPVDLDLLYYDDLVMHSAALTLPHPRMEERGFVLVPLSEIRPDLVSVEKRRAYSAGVTIWKSSW